MAFARNMVTGLLAPQQQQMLGAVPGASEQALYRELHGLALALYQAHQDVLAAQARGDVPYMRARLQDAANLQRLFADTAAQFRATGQLTDPDGLTAIDRIIVTAGNWIQASVAALPGAIAALPNAFVAALALILEKAGGAATKAVFPWIVLLGGLGLVLFLGVRKAETTRTYRRYVA